MKPLPPNFVKLMADADRKALSKDFDTRTPTEAQAEWQTTQERNMHTDFIQWLNRHGIYFVHSRMDKKSTIRKGAPDFHCLYKGRGCAVEMKAPGGVLRGDQKTAIAEMELAGVPVIVAESLQEAIEFTRKELGI